MSEQRPRVFGYARASTKHQEDSPDTQKGLIRKYADLHDLGDVVNFVDAAKSGKIPWADRDAGRELFNQIRPGDHVVIAKLDRAFRRLADCVAVLDRFQRMGVNLHVVNLMGGALDLSSPMGRFLIHILAAFAELERAFTSERTKDGLARRKEKKVCHSRFAGYGFKWEKRQIEGKWCKVKVRDDDERKVMKSILQWRMQDNALSWKQISDHLSYTLKMRTKDGGAWDVNRVRRACMAELQLQMAEQSQRL